MENTKMTRILLRDLLTRLAQADPKEIYVEIEEPEQDVFVVPIAAVLGLPDLTGVIEPLDQTSGILQAGPTPPVLAFQEANGVMGNGAVIIGAAAQTWELRSVSLTSFGGGNYGVLDDLTLVAAIIAIGAGATGELLTVGVPVAGGSSISIQAGQAGDAFNLRAVRLL